MIIFLTLALTLIGITLAVLKLPGNSKNNNPDKILSPVRSGLRKTGNLNRDQQSSVM